MQLYLKKTSEYYDPAQNNSTMDAQKPTNAKLTENPECQHLSKTSKRFDQVLLIELKCNGFFPILSPLAS